MPETNVSRLALVRHAVASGEARRIREAARLSLGEMADAADVAASTIWRWEQGQRIPRGHQALRYATVLDELRQWTTSEEAKRRERAHAS